MTVGGRVVIPDAFAHDLNVLPHEYHDVDGFFPAAAAAPSLDDMDPEENHCLEAWGVGIGKAAVQATRAISSCAVTRKR